MSIVTREDSGMGCMRQVVHGVGLTSFDFGDTKGGYDYETGQMRRVFISKPATEEVLEKYHITLEEYEEVCRVLAMEFTDWGTQKQHMGTISAIHPAAADFQTYYRRNQRRMGQRKNRSGRDARLRTTNGKLIVACRTETPLCEPRESACI